MRILYKPKVYLVGKTQPEIEGFKAFLKDQNLEWPTPNSFGYYDVPVAETIDEFLETNPKSPEFQSEIGSDFDENVPRNQTLIELMGRNCYMSYGNKAGSNSNEKYLDNLIGFNREGIAHGSVTEHINFNFMVVGGGRGFSHEQVRHRVGWAYSQLSTRYCDFEREEEEGTWDPGFCVPRMAQLSQQTTQFFTNSLKEAVKNYTIAYKMIYDDILRYLGPKKELGELSIRERKLFVRKAARGAARDLLPVGTEAIMGMTGNARTIWNCIVLRASKEAEPQIREIYVQIARIMQKELPGIFKGLKYEENWDGTTFITMPKEKL